MQKPQQSCQLNELPEAGTAPGPIHRSIFRAIHLSQQWASRLEKAVADPSLILAKAKHLTRPGSEPVPEPVPSGTRSSLGLRPGERVRVRSLEAIRSTLDQDWQCEGLGFMAEMKPFCGAEFTVKARVDRFFDERSRRMLRLRNVVLLEGVFCQPAVASPSDYAGCQRSCFLFWKEAWLERAAHEDESGPR